MHLQMIEQDVVSGLSLFRDDNDPPRYYVRSGRRQALIAIGDAALARSRFAAWKTRFQESGTRTIGRSPVKTDEGSVVAGAAPVLPAVDSGMEVSF